MLGYLTQGMNEPHVQHMVCLIQHQIACGVQRHIATFNQINQTAGGGDQNICAAFQAFGLFEKACTAHNHGNFNGGAFGELFKVGGNLRHQFAGGGKDQGAHGFGGRRMTQIKDAVQQGQTESGSFAGAGLRQTHQIAPRHDMRNGFDLNRGRQFQGGFFECFQYGGRKPQISKSLFHNSLSGSQTPPSTPDQGRQWEATAPRAGPIPRAVTIAEPLRAVGTSAKGLTHAHAARTL